MAGACLDYLFLQTPAQSGSYARVHPDVFKYLVQLSKSLITFYYNALTIFFRILCYFIYFLVVDIATLNVIIYPLYFLQDYC